VLNNWETVTKLNVSPTYCKREFATAQLVPLFRNSIVTYLNIIDVYLLEMDSLYNMIIFENMAKEAKIFQTVVSYIYEWVKCNQKFQ